MLFHLQPDVLLFAALKTLAVHSDRVVPNRKQRDEIMSGVVRLGFAGNTGPLRGYLYACPHTTDPVLSVTVPKKLAVA